MSNCSQTEAGRETPPEEGQARERPTEPQITVELLETRLGAMSQQRQRLMSEAAQVHGAMQFCAGLIAVLKGEEPVDKPLTDVPTGEQLEELRAAAKAADLAARVAQAEEADLAARAAKAEKDAAKRGARTKKGAGGTTS